MSILNFDNKPGRTPKKQLNLLLGVGGMATVIALASTLAANININSGPVEFGQGVSQTVACDDSITITPKASFSNDAYSYGEFYFTSFAVTDISTDCDGKVLTIKAYKDGQSGPLDLYLTDGLYDFNKVSVLYSRGNFSFVGGGLLSDDIWSIPGGFEVTLVTVGPPPSVPMASARDVDRITIESSDAVNEVLDIECQSVPSDAPSYYPCGPQLDVPLSTLTAAGWTPCFEDNYNNETRTVADALNSCTGNYLAVFGQEVNGSTALLLSVAPRNEVFTVTDGNRPHFANGTYWYYTPINDEWTYDPSGNGNTGYAQSLGFAPNAIINQSTCDYSQEIGDPTSPYRLCWHIENDSEPTFVNGYRIGLIMDEEGGNYQPGNYLRVIYQHSGTNE